MRRPAGVEIDVGPLQPERLASAHGRRGEQDPERVVPVLGGA